MCKNASVGALPLHETACIQNDEYEKTIKTLKGNELNLLSVIKKQQREVAYSKMKPYTDPTYHTLE